MGGESGGNRQAISSSASRTRYERRASFGRAKSDSGLWSRVRTGPPVWADQIRPRTFVPCRQRYGTKGPGRKTRPPHAARGGGRACVGEGNLQSGNDAGPGPHEFPGNQCSCFVCPAPGGPANGGGLHATMAHASRMTPTSQHKTRPRSSSSKGGIWVGLVDGRRTRRLTTAARQPVLPLPPPRVPRSERPASLHRHTCPCVR